MNRKLYITKNTNTRQGLLWLVPKLHFGTQLLLKFYFVVLDLCVLCSFKMFRTRKIQFCEKVRSEMQFRNEPGRVNKSKFRLLRRPEGIPRNDGKCRPEGLRKNGQMLGIAGQVLILMILVFLFFSFSVNAEPVSAEKPILRVMQHIAMNADVELVMYGDPDMDPEALVEVGRAVFDAIDRLEGRISRWKADSYTSLVNRTASKQPVVVAQELMDILLEAKRFYETTDGVFDVTVGPLLERWGFYAKKGGAVPSPEELAKIKEHIGFNHVILNPTKRTVFFDKAGVRIDFGGIGKGLALDYGAAILRENDIKAARIHIGFSTIRAIGVPPGKSGWTVDINSPYNTEEDTLIATIDIRNESLSTSSRTERYVEIDGHRYGHIIDPRTGMPAEGVLSATAIAPTGLESDALSTSFYVMGLEKTREYCELHSEVRAMLVVEKDDAPETIFINFDNHKE